MKRVAAFLLAALLLATLPLCAHGEARRVLYPGQVLSGTELCLIGVPLSDATVDVTAGGVSIGGSAATREKAGLGMTFYCVVDQSSSFSNYQKEQQRLGLLAMSEALGEKDAMVLVTMGKGSAIGQRLTDPEQRREAIEAACSYDERGTYLFETIDTVLKTVAEEETGFSCITVFTDGIDESGVVKVNEEQAGRYIAESGMCVNFVALLTFPPTAYARKMADRLERYAGMSLGGMYRVPLDEGDGTISTIGTVEDAVRDMVQQTREWTVLRLNTDAIPRTEKTVELRFDFQIEGQAVTDVVTVDTAQLPPLPEPETEPPTLPPTQPPETVPTVPRSTEPIPEYRDANEGNLRTLALIGAGVIGVLILLGIVIVVSDKRKPAPLPEVEFLKAPPRKAPPAPVLPTEPEPAAPQAVQKPEKAEPEQPNREKEITEKKPEAIPEVKLTEKPQGTPEKQPEEPPKEMPEETPQETPAETQKAPDAPEEDGYHGSFLSGREHAAVTAEDESLMKYLLGDSQISLEQLLSGYEPEEQEQPAQPQEQPAPREPEPMPEIRMEPEKREPQAPKHRSAPRSVTEEWDLTAELAEPEEEKADDRQRKDMRKRAPEGTSRVADLFGGRREPKPEKEKDSLHQSVAALRAAQRRSADAESSRMSAPPAPPVPGAGRPGGCTVRLTPEGNPAGTVYVTMERGGSRTLGRSEKADIVLNSGDSSLSGRHFELQWDGHVLYLTDCGSTNGTSLTGVPQRPGRWSKVESGASIQAGSVRYKVRITRN